MRKEQTANNMSKRNFFMLFAHAHAQIKVK